MVAFSLLPDTGFFSCIDTCLLCWVNPTPIYVGWTMPVACPDLFSSSSWLVPVSDTSERGLWLWPDLVLDTPSDFLTGALICLASILEVELYWERDPVPC